MNERGQLAMGVVAGCIAWVCAGGLCFVFLRQIWDAYAAAEPSKSYTLTMQLARLTVGAAAALAAGWTAARVSGGRSLAVWIVGAVLLAVSAWSHIFDVWEDYPFWYHAVYLATLIPLVSLGGLLCVRSAAPDPA